MTFASLPTAAKSTGGCEKIRPGSAKQLADLPRVIRTRATKVLERLARWPAVSGAKPLTGKLAGKYRIRTGDYRLQFHVTGKRLKIGHRDRFDEE